MDPLKTALVLGGGGARGAYEAGVISFLREELEPELGRSLPLSILCGTSVGALNACHLATNADAGRWQGRRLTETWRSISLESMLHLRAGDFVRVVCETIGWKRGSGKEMPGLVDPSGLRDLILHCMRWPGIGRNIRAGFLDALSVSATHLASGKTFTFIQRSAERTPPWSEDPHFISLCTRIGPHHALASAAIPLVFPPVKVGRSLFADGGLRLNVPLSPALRLGAERVIVVSLRHKERTPSPLSEEWGHATLPFLAGKTLNALTLDSTEQDLERLRRLNALIDAGTRAYGPEFAAMLDSTLAPSRRTPLRYVRNILVHPSDDLAKLAGEYARSPAFLKRARGLAAHFIRRLADSEDHGSADLLSYLLFDSGYAELLMDLGRRDARALGDKWDFFFSEKPHCAAEEARSRSVWPSSFAAEEEPVVHPA
jgi:NTE family protein